MITRAILEMVVINKDRPERSLAAQHLCSLDEGVMRCALLVRQHQRVQAEKAEQAEDTQWIQDGTYAMQTDNIEGVDELSQKSRKQLKAQIERVQKEARRLR